MIVPQFVSSQFWGFQANIQIVKSAVVIMVPSSASKVKPLRNRRVVISDSWEIHYLGMWKKYLGEKG